ncbi:hypothetical protein D3C73_1320620 [compost metagenome]
MRGNHRPGQITAVALTKRNFFCAQHSGILHHPVLGFLYLQRFALKFCVLLLLSIIHGCLRTPSDLCSKYIPALVSVHAILTWEDRKGNFAGWFTCKITHKKGHPAV